MCGCAAWRLHSPLLKWFLLFPSCHRNWLHYSPQWMKEWLRIAWLCNHSFQAPGSLLLSCYRLPFLIPCAHLDILSSSTGTHSDWHGRRSEAHHVKWAVEGWTQWKFRISEHQNNSTSAEYQNHSPLNYFLAVHLSSRGCLRIPRMMYWSAR